MANGTTTFSAKQPALGYYYQILRGLVLLLGENTMKKPELSFECLDDISITDGREVDLYQTKLHIRKAQLSDRSTDFWKTIRVWSQEIKDGLLNPEETIFTLITTANVSEDSFISLFKTRKAEDRKTIFSTMETIATETSSDTNMLGYKAFGELSEEQKRLLVKNIVIVDSEVSVEDTLNELERLLELSAPSSALNDFIEKIVGWWFLRSVKMLLSAGTQRISRESLKNQIDSLRDQIRADALPEDFYAAVEVSDDELTESESKTYIKQLSLIDATKREKRAAISDYRRAYGQRSKWLRDGRVNQEEYDVFDSNLCDDWNQRHGLLEDKTEGIDDAGRKDAGHEFYRSFYVDPQHTMPSFKNKGLYITKGSYQMLSDFIKIGWHPNYKKLLENDETVE